MIEVCGFMENILQ